MNLQSIKKLNAQDTATISKLFFKLLPIQVMIIAMGAINSIVDGSVAGQFIDAQTVGVVGMYYVIINILNAIGNTLLGGTSVLCGRYMGAGDIEKTKGIFSLNIVSTVFFGGIVTLVSLLFPGQIADLLGANPELRPALTTYIVGYAFGIIPQLLAQQIAAFLQLERQSKRGYVGVGAMIVSNIAGDILFVAVFKMGILGLAISTTLSNWIYFLIQGQYYLTAKAQLKFNLKSIDFKELIPMIKIGAPGAMLVLCLALRGMVLNRLLLNYAGTDGLSAMSAYNMVSGFFLAYCLGVGAVVRMLTSVFIGEENPAPIKALAKIVFTKGFGITIVISAIIILLSGALTRVFFPDSASNVYSIAKQLMTINGACIPLILICCINTNYLQAWGHNIYVNLLSVFDGFFAMIIPAMLLAPVLGVMGIWLANPIGILLTVLLTPLYCIIYWKLIPKSSNQWLFIPEGFGAVEKDRLDIQIKEIQDVTNTAVRVQEFCNNHNTSDRLSYYAALCLEEMAGNVVEHGFNKDNKKHSIDAHVVYKVEGIMLRIKDDCIPFNPAERARLTDSDDPLKNIGIRMVLKLADEVTYHNLLGLNVLTIMLKDKDKQ